MKKIKGNKLCSILSSLCLLFLSLLIPLYSTIWVSSPVSAISLAPDVWLVTSATDPQYSLNITTNGEIGSWKAWQNGLYNVPTYSGIYGVAIKGNKNSSLANGFNWQARDFFAITITIQGDAAFDQSYVYGGASIEILQTELVASVQNSAGSTYTYQLIGQMWTAGSGSLDFFPSYLRAENSNFYFTVNSVMQFRYQNTTVNVDVDTGSVVNAIKDSQSYQQATTNAVNAAKDQAHADAQAQKDAIDAQTQQQKDQYDQEKQEEQDRETNLDDASNSIGRLFNFNLINPLAGIFGLFSDGSSCANIPTIASWVHSKDSVVCPWFPTSVRSVLTPVLGLSSTMILLYFVVHWSLRLTETT